MVNKVILVGNVGQDPEVREVGDQKVANFSLATTETYKNKDGEKVSNTEWHRIVAWRHLARLAESYITKGKPLYVEGKVTYRTYGDDGNKKYITEVIASSIQLLGSRGGDKPQDSPSSPKDDFDKIMDGDSDVF